MMNNALGSLENKLEHSPSFTGFTSLSDDNKLLNGSDSAIKQTGELILEVDGVIPPTLNKPTALDEPVKDDLDTGAFDKDELLTLIWT